MPLQFTSNMIETEDGQCRCLWTGFKENGVQTGIALPFVAE